jgi:hypothetical protein
MMDDVSGSGRSQVVSPLLSAEPDESAAEEAMLAAERRAFEVRKSLIIAEVKRRQSEIAAALAIQREQEMAFVGDAESDGGEGHIDDTESTIFQVNHARYNELRADGTVVEPLPAYDEQPIRMPVQSPFDDEPEDVLYLSTEDPYQHVIMLTLPGSPLFENPDQTPIAPPLYRDSAVSPMEFRSRVDYASRTRVSQGGVEMQSMGNQQQQNGARDPADNVPPVTPAQLAALTKKNVRVKPLPLDRPLRPDLIPVIVHDDGTYTLLGAADEEEMDDAEAKELDLAETKSLDPEHDEELKKEILRHENRKRLARHNSIVRQLRVSVDPNDKNAVIRFFVSGSGDTNSGR